MIRAPLWEVIAITVLCWAIGFTMGYATWGEHHSKPRCSHGTAVDASAVIVNGKLVKATDGVVRVCR